MSELVSTLSPLEFKLEVWSENPKAPDPHNSAIKDSYELPWERCENRSRNSKIRAGACACILTRIQGPVWENRLSAQEQFLVSLTWRPVIMDPCFGVENEK